MLQDVLLSASRLPLLFRGDVMRQSSMGVLLLVSPPMLLFLAFKVRSGMRVSVACLWAILGIYASWAAGLLFEPSARAADPYLVDSVGHWINLVPFATIAAQVRTTSGSALVQLVGNVGLLLPLGLIGPIVMPSLRRAPRLALVALGGSVAIELVQLVGTSVRLIDRSVDVDDVILNVAGALLGWLLWRVIAPLRVRAPRSTVLDESLS
jgi:glycopeptide antibiotics resistance protein